MIRRGLADNPLSTRPERPYGRGMTTHAPAPAPMTATVDGIPGELALTGFPVAARNTTVTAGWDVKLNRSL